MVLKYIKKIYIITNTHMVHNTVTCLKKRKKNSCFIVFFTVFFVLYHLRINKKKLRKENKKINKNWKVKKCF